VVVTVRVKAVAWLVMVTTAPGIAPPLVSSIVPLTAPAPSCDCAKVNVKVISPRKTAMMNLFIFIVF
jgi:hypothetical protein